MSNRLDWSRLICDKRLGLEQYHQPRQIRNDFQRDYDRMIFSSPFRRLQNKTQVFPLPGSIFVHNRLTHSLEVSSVGRSLAREVADRLSDRHGPLPALNYFGDIVAAACLCHDLGNPPFGHSGEQTIRAFFCENEALGATLKPSLSHQQWTDLIHFEGNANSFRLLTHQFCGRRAGGFAMTYSTLASMVKYPFSSLEAGAKGKFGFFTSEQEIWERVAGELGLWRGKDGRYVRHPLVYIVEAADDICYQIMDIEDAHRLGVVSTAQAIEVLSGIIAEEHRAKEVEKLKRVSDPNEQIAFLRSTVIGVLVQACAKEFVDSEDAILTGTYTGSLIANVESAVARGYATCSELAWKRIYRAPDVVDVEIAGNRIITYLLECLTQAVLYPEKTSAKMLLAKVPEQYDVHAVNLYDKLLAVLDHVSGMTDVYALNLFRKLNGHSLPAV